MNDDLYKEKYERMRFVNNYFTWRSQNKDKSEYELYEQVLKKLKKYKFFKEKIEENLKVYKMSIK